MTTGDTSGDSRSNFLDEIRNFGGKKGKLKSIEERKKQKKQEKEQAKELPVASSMTVQEQLKLALKARRGFIDGSKLDNNHSDKSPTNQPSTNENDLPSFQMSNSSNSGLNQTTTSSLGGFDNISKMIPPPPPTPNNASSPKHPGEVNLESDEDSDWE